MGPDVSPRPTVCAVTADLACGPSPKHLPAPGGDQVTWRNLKAELRELVPIGDVDGNTAIAGLSRVATWLDHDVASAEVPFE